MSRLSEDAVAPLASRGVVMVPCPPFLPTGAPSGWLADYDSVYPQTSYADLIRPYIEAQIRAEWQVAAFETAPTLDDLLDAVIEWRSFYRPNE